MTTDAMPPPAAFSGVSNPSGSRSISVKRKYQMIGAPSTSLVSLLRDVSPASEKIIPNFVSASSSVSPHEHLLFMSGKKREQLQSSLQVKHFFLEYTDAQIDAYDNDIVRAVRMRNIDDLRAMHLSGKEMQCANRFGESILHIACRRGFVDVIRFLVDEAGLSVKVRDDYGRTVLHDACWTVNPNEELVEYLISKCPDLLFFNDKRGSAPLEYVRKEHWDTWLRFLSKRRDILPRAVEEKANSAATIAS